MIKEQIASQFGVSVSYVERLARTASHRYVAYKIKKRSGGEREIHHPSRALKAVQHWLLQNVLNKLPVHSLATAYQKGSSIRINAEMHVANNYILRIDFENFFPSLKGSDVVSVLKANQQVSSFLSSHEDLDFIRKIVCLEDALTIGAPTSPLLANAIMFSFDTEWAQRARTLETTYTRYADDLYFSTNRPNILRDILLGLTQYLRENRQPQLQINDSKTAFSSRKRRRIATGLVLTSDRRVSIGRAKKRMLKSWVNKLKYQELNSEQIACLRGWIAYLRSTEPLFVAALQRKYQLDFRTESTWKMKPTPRT
jgi:retron-type reverse transcriptase